MKTLETIVTWLLVSSADPSKASLTVKAVLVGLIPVIMQSVSLACGFHLICASLDGNLLQTLAETVSNIIFLALSIVSALGVVLGLSRKIWRTFSGTNLAIQ